MSPDLKRHVTWAGAAAALAAALGLMTMLTNWALETDAKIGNSEHQRLALVQADSALFARDSLKDLRLISIERQLKIKVRRQRWSPQPQPPAHEGILKRLFHLFV